VPIMKLTKRSIETIEHPHDGSQALYRDEQLRGFGHGRAGRNGGNRMVGLGIQDLVNMHRRLPGSALWRGLFSFQRLRQRPSLSRADDATAQDPVAARPGSPLRR